MRTDLFGGLLILSEVAAVALALATHPVVSGIGASLWLTLRYGYLGVLFTLLVTFPIIRRWGVVVAVLFYGAIPLLIAAVMFSGNYANIQMWLQGEGAVKAGDLSKLPIDHPRLAKLSGIWRYDLTYRGSRRISRLHHSPSGPDQCWLVRVHFCRTPVVGRGWKPGEPVLALSDECGDHKPRARTVDVRLFPAAGHSVDGGLFTGFGIDDSEQRGKSILCSLRPADGHIDMSKAPFRFDAKRGVLIVSTEFEWPHPQTDFFWFGLYLAGWLAITTFATRDDGKPSRILRRGEPEVEAGGAAADPDDAGGHSGGDDDGDNG